MLGTRGLVCQWMRQSQEAAAEGFGATEWMCDNSTSDDRYQVAGAPCEVMGVGHKEISGKSRPSGIRSLIDNQKSLC